MPRANFSHWTAGCRCLILGWKLHYATYRLSCFGGVPSRIDTGRIFFMLCLVEGEGMVKFGGSALETYLDEH